MKKTIAILFAALMMTSINMSAFALTAPEVSTENSTSDTAGTQSAYGPSLSREQLDEVAQATADFLNSHITDSMSRDEKIRAAFDYLKNRTTTDAWDSQGASTAYALVTKKGTSFGMSFAMKALCDAMGVECYCLQSTEQDHQWNLIRFDDGTLYHVDIEDCKSSGMDDTYKSLWHPLKYDTTAYPIVGSTVSQQDVNDTTEKDKPPSNCVNVFTSGKGKTWDFIGSPVDDTPMKTVVNGKIIKNQWVCITYEDNGEKTWYYFDGNGDLFKNGLTPDNYRTGEFGHWSADYSYSTYDSEHTYRVGQEGGVMQAQFGAEGTPEYADERRLDVLCQIIDPCASTFRFPSSKTNINPIGHRVAFTGFMETPYGLIAIAKNGEPVTFPLELDKTYSLDFTGRFSTAEGFADYCKKNAIVIKIFVYDENVHNNSGLQYEWLVAYADENSQRTN